MKIKAVLTTILLAANLCQGGELQQKYEKAYFLETAKGRVKEAAAIYNAISEAEPTDENRAAIKQSLLRLLHIATVRKHEATIKDCHEKLLQKTDTPIQELIDATKAGGTVYIPAGKYTEPLSIDKEIVLKGSDREQCIIEATSDRPLVFAAPKSKLTLESLTLKNQLETSRKTDPPGFTLVAKDASVTARDCRFAALGNNQRSPGCVYAMGFSNVQLEGCRFEGFEYTIRYGAGTEGHVKDCVVQNPGHCGITAFQDSEVVIERNIVTGSAYHGIRSTGGIIHVKDNLMV